MKLLIILRERTSRVGRRFRRRVRRVAQFWRDTFSSTAATFEFIESLPQQIRRAWERKIRDVKEALRNPRYWLPAVPAFFAIICWIVFTLYAGIWWTVPHIVSTYRSHAAESFLRSDFETARIACERLPQLDSGERARALFGIAMALEALGKADDARAYLNQIAPVNRLGHVPAHVHLAKQLLTGTNATADAVKVAEVHLKHVVSAERGHTEANLMLGQLYLRSGARELAKEHLKRAVEKNRDALLLVARICAAERDELETHIWASKAVGYYREQMERSNDPTPRIRCAEAMALLNDHAGAVSILERSYQQTTNEVYRAQLGNVFAAWFDSVPAARSNLATRVALVERGLRYAPRNQRLLSHLVRLAGMDGAETTVTRELVKELVESGRAGATLHFCLGVDAWERKDNTRARDHLEIAFKLAPEMPFIANNLAVVLSADDGPEVSRALTIIDSVLDRYPNEPYFRDTRGQVLARLKRWKEAAVDLERALPKLSRNLTTHKNLAEVYKNLGMEELSEQHERIAMQLASGR